MSRHRQPAISALALTSCHPFHRAPAIEVITKDANLSSRWPADLATAAELHASAANAAVTVAAATLHRQSSSLPLRWTEGS